MQPTNEGSKSLNFEKFTQEAWSLTSDLQTKERDISSGRIEKFLNENENLLYSDELPDTTRDIVFEIIESVPEDKREGLNRIRSKILEVLNTKEVEFFKNASPFENIPPEIRVQIFGNLAPKDLVSLSKVTKRIGAEARGVFLGKINRGDVKLSNLFKPEDVEKAIDFAIKNQLKYVNLEGFKVTASQVKKLCNGNKEITHLFIRSSQLDDAIVADIVNLQKLITLDLRGNEIGADGAGFIARSEHLKNLTSLNLGYNQIGAAGAKSIAGSELLKNLTSLYLEWNEIGADGAKFIEGSEHLKNLTSLNFSSNRIGDAGAKSIAGSEHLKNLTSLNLWGNQIGAEGAGFIAGSEYLKNLTSLDLQGNQIGDDGAGFIAGSEHLKTLTSLNLWGNQIGAEGAGFIAGSEHFKNLTSLNLGYNQIGDAGAGFIAGSEHLKNLTSLKLADNHIGDAGKGLIRRSQNLKNVISLNF